MKCSKGFDGSFVAARVNVLDVAFEAAQRLFVAAAIVLVVVDVDFGFHADVDD